MKLLLIHLSDIHVKAGDNIVALRAAAIASAVRPIANDIDAAITVVSGDIAYSGVDAEYERATHFLTSLTGELKSALPDIQLSWVVAPGNHDCFLPDADEQLRKTVIEGVQKENARAADSSYVQFCTSAQGAFFRFRDSFAPPHRATALQWDYLIPVGAETVRVKCLNSAWVSQRKETPGSLVYPAYDASTDDALSLSVTVMHHPYNWFDPDNLRLFKPSVELSSDLILTGHEHESGAFSKVTHSNATRNEFIEGSVLQDSGDATNSGFNALIVNTDQQNVRILALTWKGDLYEIADDTQHTFRLNGSIRREQFAVSESFDKVLRDPGVRLFHNAKELVDLDDIFVWPDLREVSYSKKQFVMSSEKLRDRARTDKRILITAPERAGKTMLCKQLFRAFKSDGLVPLLISARESSLSGDNLPTVIKRAFKSQYSPDGFDRYQQLAPASKVLIIDDIDRVGAGRADQLAFINKAATHAEILIVTANDLTHQIEELVYSRGSRIAQVEFRPYRLLEFGHVLRHSLVEKWYAIGSDPLAAAERLARDWSRTRHIIDTVVGKNFVPAYPIFVLSLLQSLEASQPVDTNASTYGYFYEMLIRESLRRSSSQNDAITKNEYLARLARHLFETQQQRLTEQELRDVHASYEKEMDLVVSFRRFVDDLEKCRILELDEGTYRFVYHYTYYYFVATHMRDRIGEIATRDAITRMSSNLHVEEYANILLFLAHLTRDPFVINAMLQQAAKIYADRQPAMLESDVDFLNLASGEFDFTYQDGDVTVSRRKLLSHLDELDRKEETITPLPQPLDVEGDRQLDDVLRLNVALKTIQILGQILKNFTGSIVGDLKVQIAEECYRLGLRTLASMLDLIRCSEEAVVEFAFEMLRREHPSSPDEMLFEKAKVAPFWFAQIISYGLIKKVAYALGSDRLTQTYKRVKDRNKSVAVALIDTSLKLDHGSNIPEPQILTLKKLVRNNALADSLLKQLVVHHFYMFDVHIEIKQRLCERLRIAFTAMQTADRRQKLIVKPVFTSPKLLPPPPA